MAEQIGFMGLGALGLPIATNLLDSGYALTVYNRTASKADPLVKRGACLVSQPADTVTSGGVVVNVMWDMLRSRA
jgi:3-hydroxyisobutyrate dehydrogenase-like beta-hydroxyacid dehydrogenase